MTLIQIDPNHDFEAEVEKAKEKHPEVADLLTRLYAANQGLRAKALDAYSRHLQVTEKKLKLAKKKYSAR